MVTESGFKECPRCGLRNSKSALNCRFCSYEFEGVKEEWDEYLEILETLAQEDEEVEEESSTRIKATFIKPDEMELERPVPLEEASEVGAPAGEVEAPIEGESTEADNEALGDAAAVTGSEVGPSDALHEESISEDVEETGTEVEVPEEEPLEEEVEEPGDIPDEIEEGTVQDEAQYDIVDEERSIEGVDQDYPGEAEEGVYEVPATESPAEVEVVEVGEAEAVAEGIAVEQRAERASSEDAVEESVSVRGKLSLPFAYLFGESSGFVGTIFLVTGVIVYLIALFTGLFGSIGGLVGWALSIIGALGLIIGLNGIYKNWVPSK